jgi:hypothetical protein
VTSVAAALRDALPSPPRRPFGGSFHLDPDQALLLRAAFAVGPEAIDAYRGLRDSIDLDRASVSVQRLLPLLVRRLESDGGFDGDPLLARFRKVARFTWLKSQLLVAEATPALAALCDAAIPMLIVKGAAVVDRTGGDLAGRPMDDIDVVVPAERARQAFAVLEGVGFVPDGGPLSEGDTEALLLRRHALETVNAKGAAIDLHWHALAGCLRAADERFWGGADVTTFGDVPCLVTNREDSMVHAIAHAFGSRPDGGLRWASDVAVLSGSGRGAVDWDRFIGTARACRVGVAAADALDVLNREIELGAPVEVLAELRRAPLTERVRAWPRLDRSGAPRLPGRAEALADAYEEYLGQQPDPETRPSLRGVGDFLAHRWALPSAREVPRHALFVAAGRPWGAKRRWRDRGGAPGSASVGSSAGPGTSATGREFRFHLGGDGIDRLTRGWSNPEAHGIWTVGSEATVTLPVPEGPPGPGAVLVRLVPFLSPRRRRLRVDLVVNGERCARWIFEGEGWEPRELWVPIGPGVMPRQGTVEFRFVIGQPLSPEAAGLEAGTRPLGISLHTLRIDRLGW